MSKFKTMPKQYLIIYEYVDTKDCGHPKKVKRWKLVDGNLRVRGGDGQAF